MALPKVDIQLQSGQLGRIDDLGGGLGGIIVVMAAAPTGLAFGAVGEYAALADMPAELQLVPGLINYFALAEGRKLYVMPVANTVDIDDIVDKDAATPHAKNLLLAGNGDIRFLGVIDTVDVAEVAAALTKAQALAVARAAVYDPVLVVLPYDYADADTAVDLSAGSYNRCACVISNAGDEVGLLIGKLASTPVQRNIGRVKDGALPVATAYVDKTNSVLVEDGMTTVETLHNKGYITLRTHIGKTGYYFSDDLMACAATDDYGIIANRRVIDKAMIVAYQVFLNELLDEVQVDTASGKLSPGVVKYYQSIIKNAIELQMQANGEISGVTAFVDPAQNVLSTSQITVVLSIVPVGYAKAIVVKLGFDNPFN